MLRIEHKTFPAHPKQSWLSAAAASFLLTGCTMSVPGFGSDDSPVVTGSIAPPVEIREPLPQTLAYSDATRIGQAADAAL